jgi:glycosyltransferase involved in cell wall biosynthesis
MKVLVVTNLFGYPWDPARGMFNQQQFDRLARVQDLRVLVAVPWTEAVRRPRAWWNARRDGRTRWPYVDYFVFWYLPGFAQSWHALFFFLSMLLQRPLLLLPRFDVILGSWGFPDAVASTLLGRLTGTPALMKVHGSDVNDYLASPGKRWQLLAAARRCSSVMTPSAALRGRLVEAGLSADRVCVNYNGVDTTRFHPADRAEARERQAVPMEAALLLYVGNLKRAKGCLDLVDAFVGLAADFPALLLVVVGQGAERGAMIERVASTGLSDRVRFMGTQDHAAIAAWFAAADLLCLPSHNEGVPNVVLESMACGLPVVATRVGGIPEVLPPHAGLLVPASDPAALQAALRSALRTPWDRARIAAHASGFSWDDNLMRLNAALIDAGGPAPAPGVSA